jgi:alpha-L-rhamnosidase
LDTYDTAYIPQDGNALALLFGLAEGERAERVMDTLKRENWSPYGSAMMSAPSRAKDTRDGVYTISPPFCTYEAEARFLLGDDENALQLIKNCWGTMIRKGAKTFWEYAPNHPADCWQYRAHAWSAGCTYLLSAYVLGIRPQKAGYDKVLFRPSAQLDSFQGVVPTPRGEIAVSCRGKDYTLAIPRGLLLKAELPEGTDLNIIEY